MTISNIEKQETDFILKTVETHFVSDRSFYNGIVPQRSWDRLKTGESSLWNMATKSYQGMLDKLYSPYEQYLLKLSRQHVQFNWASTIEEAFNDLKMKHTYFMVKQDARISVEAGRYETGPSDKKSIGTSLKVENELGDYISFNISVPPHQVPSGKQNRKEWFQNEFKKVVVL